MDRFWLVVRFSERPFRRTGVPPGFLSRDDRTTKSPRSAVAGPDVPEPIRRTDPVRGVRAGARAVGVLRVLIRGADARPVGAVVRARPVRRRRTGVRRVDALVERRAVERVDVARRRAVDVVRRLEAVRDRRVERALEDRAERGAVERDRPEERVALRAGARDAERPDRLLDFDAATTSLADHASGNRIETTATSQRRFVRRDMENLRFRGCGNKYMRRVNYLTMLNNTPSTHKGQAQPIGSDEKVTQPTEMGGGRSRRRTRPWVQRNGGALRSRSGL